MKTTEAINDDNFQQVNAEEPSQPKPAAKLTTNRTKAIIYTNLYNVFQLSYLATMKHAVNELKVNPLDQVIYRNVLSGIVAAIVALFVG